MCGQANKLKKNIPGRACFGGDAKVRKKRETTERPSSPPKRKYHMTVRTDLFAGANFQCGRGEEIPGRACFRSAQEKKRKTDKHEYGGADISANAEVAK